MSPTQSSHVDQRATQIYHYAGFVKLSNHIGQVSSDVGLSPRTHTLVVHCHAFETIQSFKCMSVIHIVGLSLHVEFGYVPCTWFFFIKVIQERDCSFWVHVPMGNNVLNAISLIQIQTFQFVESWCQLSYQGPIWQLSLSVLDWKRTDYVVESY